MALQELAAEVRHAHFCSSSLDAPPKSAMFGVREERTRKFLGTASVGSPSPG